MKTWRLVAGILSCILFLVTSFQSCAAGLGEAMQGEGTSGAAGIVLSVLMLAGGIVSICVRNSAKKGAAICLIVLFGIAALLGFGNAQNFPDLQIWAAWCLINAILAAVSLFVKGKKNEVK